ncbi:MAG: thioredoxin family protein, partial [Panacagrimonas sp.]
MSLMQTFRSAGLAGVVALAACAAAQAAPRLGEVAPAFEVAGAAGKPGRLADIKGKDVVGEWTNEGCPFV